MQNRRRDGVAIRPAGCGDPRIKKTGMDCVCARIGRRAGTPDPEGKAMVALIIIDMQCGMFTGDTPRFDSENVIKNILQTADAVRSADGKVIIIQHDGNTEEGYAPHTEEWQLIPQIRKIKPDAVVHKTACDAFYRTELEDYLRSHAIRRLIITGCATDFCVDTTVRAAASKDFAVMVASDGHTTADRPPLTARQVIQHHNWVWKNLILPNGKIKVLTTEEILRRLGGTDG
jgi:nicotinamidase-related amidase